MSEARAVDLSPAAVERAVLGLMQAGMPMGTIDFIAGLAAAVRDLQDRLQQPMSTCEQLCATDRQGR